MRSTTHLSEPAARANPYAPTPERVDRRPGSTPASAGAAAARPAAAAIDAAVRGGPPEVINIVYRTPWNTRLFARVSRVVRCLLLVAVAWGVMGGVMAFNRTASPPPWLVIGLLIIPLPLAGALYLALSRRAPTRLALRDDLIQTDGWFLGRDVRYEDIRLIRIERPHKTVGRQSLLTLHASRATRMKIWLTSAEALECFHALRGLCEHAPAIGVEGETYEPLDAAHADVGRRTLAAEHRRKAAWAMASAAVLGAFALLHVAAMLFGWNAGSGRSPPVGRTIILSAVALGALMSSLEQRRRARAIEAEPRPATTFSHS
jgi:hypothetical protein